MHPIFDVYLYEQLSKLHLFHLSQKSKNLERKKQKSQGLSSLTLKPIFKIIDTEIDP